MKNAERKGVVTKRKGDFYNVALEPAEGGEESNVYAGDLVKASRKVFSRIFVKSMNTIDKNGGVGQTQWQAQPQKPKKAGNGEFGKMVGKEVAAQQAPKPAAPSKTAEAAFLGIAALLAKPSLTRADFENFVSGMDETERMRLVSMLYNDPDFNKNSRKGRAGLLYLLWLFLMKMMGLFNKS